MVKKHGLKVLVCVRGWRHERTPLIEDLSRWIALKPGDLIATGTMGGVGFSRNPPLFMKPGDVPEVTIEGIGTLRNPIEHEAY